MIPLSSPPLYTLLGATDPPLLPPKTMYLPSNPLGPKAINKDWSPDDIVKGQIHFVLQCLSTIAIYQVPGAEKLVKYSRQDCRIVRA